MLLSLNCGRRQAIKSSQKVHTFKTGVLVVGSVDGQQGDIC